MALTAWQATNIREVAHPCLHVVESRGH
eukprot:COSAG01_NODE_53584_length_338_cov_0.652720_1_plen_27_part_10